MSLHFVLHVCLLYLSPWFISRVECIYLVESNFAGLERAVSPDCPVPCGYDLQLCCAENQVCYTDSFDQAQCSSTAVETRTEMITQTITASESNQAVTSTYVVTATTTFVTTSGTVVVTTSKTIVTESRTPSTTAPSPPSATAEQTSERQGLSVAAQAGIAVGVILGVGAVVGLSWLSWRRRPTESAAANSGPANVMNEVRQDGFTVIEPAEAGYQGYRQDEEDAFQPPQYDRSGYNPWGGHSRHYSPGV